MIADLGAFAGRWRVRRRIIDLQNGSIADFEGSALISARSFEEEGIVHLGGASFPAQRVYLIEPCAGGVTLRRPDGSHFIDLGRVRLQEVAHLCGQDDYHGRFRFAGTRSWSEAWRVSGPRKNYCSFGRFTR